MKNKVYPFEQTLIMKFFLLINPFVTFCKSQFNFSLMIFFSTRRDDFELLRWKKSPSQAKITIGFLSCWSHDFKKTLEAYKVCSRNATDKRQQIMKKIIWWNAYFCLKRAICGRKNCVKPKIEAQKLSINVIWYRIELYFKDNQIELHLNGYQEIF